MSRVSLLVAIREAAWDSTEMMAGVVNPDSDGVILGKAGPGIELTGVT